MNDSKPPLRTDAYPTSITLQMVTALHKMEITDFSQGETLADLINESLKDGMSRTDLVVMVNAALALMSLSSGATSMNRLADALEQQAREQQASTMTITDVVGMLRANADTIGEKVTFLQRAIDDATGTEQNGESQ